MPTLAATMTTPMVPMKYAIQQPMPAKSRHHGNIERRRERGRDRRQRLADDFDQPERTGPQLSADLIKAAACALFSALGAAPLARATVYTIPKPGTDSIVGEDQTVVTVYEDTLYDLARKFSLGSEELIRVNPGVDPWLPGAGKTIVVPAAHFAARARVKASSSICPSTGCTTTRSPSATAAARSSPIR
jgi:hypothetical protein